ncbi:MAG: hypothetical protein GX125_08630 [Bacteroidales bacterium]|jgi:ABC-type transporter Mla subunit MlaD|nr:hypothetical protein [Bacteroidales bacterium]
MNKIYSDQVSKARMLSKGVSEHSAELSRKNITVDIGRLDKLSAALEAAAKTQEKAEDTLSKARAEAHRLLDELKSAFADAKAPIKQAFLSDEWARFGLTDKR